MWYQPRHRPGYVRRLADAAEELWRADVTAKLARLAAVQDEVRSLQIEERDRQRGSWMAWVIAAALLGFSAAVVASGTEAGMIATTEAATARSLSAQATSDLTHVANVLQPIFSLEKSKGAAYVASQATRAQVDELNTALKWGKAYRSNNDAASAVQTSATPWQLWGTSQLALAAALGGAVIGWMLTQCLASRRWRRSS